MLLVILIVITGGVSIVALFAIIRLVQLKKRFAFTPVDSNVKVLPTVSVCIPARNETHAMTECLERVLASSYPKLEIIVLDDSSVDDTSMLIKSFAHAGVRFVEGSPLPSEWLGKNHALEDLLDEASGEYVLFMDVDTIVQPYSISRLVSRIQHDALDLVSVIPQRQDGARMSVLFGTLRYFWVLFLGNRTLPAVSGAAWLVRRQKLVDMGGFQKYKQQVLPEVYIAADLHQATHSELVISNPALGICFEKKWSSQNETSIRLLEPLFKSSLGALGVSLLLLAMVFAPIVSIIFGGTAGVMAGLLSLVLTTCLALVYFNIVWKHHSWMGGLLWPIIITQEAILIIMSVVMYARGVVTWKGRLVESPLRN